MSASLSQGRMHSGRSHGSAKAPWRKVFMVLIGVVIVGALYEVSLIANVGTGGEGLKTKSLAEADKVKSFEKRLSEMEKKLQSSYDKLSVSEKKIRKHEKEIADAHNAINALKVDGKAVLPTLAFEEWVKQIIVGEGKGAGTQGDIPKGWIAGDWTGLEAGKAASATKDEIVTASVDKYAFNAHLSATLPLRRQINDVRDEGCKAVKYRPDLPTTSVVIVYADEMWSTLFRTVWNVLDTVPEHLLEEIILVDDASEAEWLKEDFNTYMKMISPKVKVITLKERKGLIRARTIGADRSTGEILVFLDAHCEGVKDWYQPIAHRIGMDYRIVICPVIDLIDEKTMEHHGAARYSIGTFRWTLDFSWDYYKPQPGENDTSPWASGTMAGGLFAMHRNYWEELGKYDLGMDGWGGENLELSFRIWQCGGRMEILPCSRVAHLFRPRHPYKVAGKGISHSFMHNSVRMATVWMDDYKDLAMKVRPDWAAEDPGDTTERVALRNKLKCKNFKWYLDNVIPNLWYPNATTVPDKTLSGQLRSEVDAANPRCLDGQDSIEPKHCMPSPIYGPNQWLFYTEEHLLRQLEKNKCLSSASPIAVHDCNPSNAGQKWEFKKVGTTGDGKPKVQLIDHTGQCITKSGDKIEMGDCSKGAATEFIWTGFSWKGF